MSKLLVLLGMGAIAGLSLITASFLWTSPLGPAPRWTTAQARQYQKAGAEYHRLAHQHPSGVPHARRDPSAAGSAHPEAETAALAAARTRWENEASQLAAARSGHQRTARLLKWSGVVLAGASLLGLLVVRSQGQQ